MHQPRTPTKNITMSLLGPLWEQVAPLVAAGQPLWDAYVPVLRAAAEPHLAAFDARAQGLQPWQVAGCGALCALLVWTLLAWLRGLLARVAEDGGMLPAVFGAIRRLPFVAARLRKEKEKIRCAPLARMGLHAPPLAASSRSALPLHRARRA